MGDRGWRRFAVIGIMTATLLVLWSRPASESVGRLTADVGGVDQSAVDSSLTDPPSTLIGLIQGVRRIPRVDGSQLTYADFVKRFASTGVPVVIYNYAEKHLPSQSWTPQKFRSVCGHRRVSFRHQYDQALSDLLASGQGPAVEAVTMRYHKLTLARYSAILQEGMTLAEYQDYMADWVASRAGRPKWVPTSVIDYFGLPFSVHTQAWAQFCPEFLEVVKIPKFFPVDYLAASHEIQNEIRAYMPEAFIAPQDSTAYPMHLHPFSTSCWLQMLKGKKQWWLFPYKENTERDPDILGADPPPAYTFRADAMRPNLAQHPQFEQAVGWEGTVEEGEILFMPAGMVHQVHNLATSYMLTHQFLDFTSIRTMLGPAIPEYYAQMKEKWLDVLDAQGLSCWDPRQEPGGLAELARLGELTLDEYNHTELHPVISKYTSATACICPADRTCHMMAYEGYPPAYTHDYHAHGEWRAPRPHYQLPPDYKHPKLPHTHRMH